MSSITTWHPTYAAFHAPYEWGTFIADVERFGRLVRGETKPKFRRLICQPSLEALRRLVEAEDFVAVDIETGPLEVSQPWTGKDPTRATLRTIGFGNQEEGCSISWAHATEPTRRYVREVLASRAWLKVFLNGPWFDIPVLRRVGLKVKNYLDLRDMRRAVSTTSRLSLRYQASLYNDTNDWKSGDEEDEKGIVFTDKIRKLQAYNAQDCVETARVFAALRSESEWEEERVHRLHEVHAKLSVIAADMYRVGLHVNAMEREFLIHCATTAKVEAQETLCALVGEPAFEATPNAMRGLIYKRHARVRRKSFELPDPLNPRMYTNENLETISVAEPSLLLLLISGECPPELVAVLDAWWDVQANAKRLGYLQSVLLDQAIGADGRLRPGWNSCGTDTMRFSCSQPNVMNIEQDMRWLLGPPKGKVWVHADKSQAELRMMSAVARDVVLQRALQTGDVYAFNTLEWFGSILPRGTTVKDVKKRHENLRKASKIIHLGSQYAAEAPTVFQQALKQDRKFTFSHTIELLRRWRNTYAGTVRYWSEEMARVQQCGYSEGRILHGRRYYPQPPTINEVANFPVQRSVGEMMNLELIDLYTRLYKSGLDAHVVVQLHDAFDVECDEGDREAVCEIMSETMNRQWEIEEEKYSFPVEIKVATAESTWAAV